jgi:hypothetical protein
MKLILQGKFPYALMDKSKYKAQMDDIIKISVENLSKSRSDRKEIMVIKSYKPYWINLLPHLIIIIMV